MAELAVVKDTQARPAGIIPERLYTAMETAGILGIRRKQTVYAIPGKLLPKLRIGPNGGLVRYSGRDILRYIDSCRERVA